MAKVNQREEISVIGMILSSFSLGLFIPNNPAKNRKYRQRIIFPTDLAFIGLYIFFLVVYVKKMELTKITTNPGVLLNLVDSTGRVCGVDDGVKNSPFIYLKEGQLKKEDRLCVSSCSEPGHALEPAIKLIVFCVPKHPKDQASSLKSLRLDTLLTLILIIIQNPYLYGISIILNILTTYFLFALIMIFSAVFIIIIGFILIGGMIATSGYLIFQPSLNIDIRYIEVVKNNADTSLIVGIVLAVVSFFALILFIISIKSIKNSAKITRKIMKTILYMPGFMIMSLFFMALTIGWIFLWCLLSINIFGSFDNNLNTVNQTEWITYFYHFLLLYWNLQILTYYLYSIISATSCEFMLNNEPNFYNQTMGILPVLVWFLRGFIQIGTISFASLLIAIIETIQSILNIAKRQMSSKETCIEKATYYIANIFLCCFKCVADWLSKKGLIYSILYNTDFITGMVKGNYLIISNVGNLLFPMLMKGVVLGLIQWSVPVIISFAVDYLAASTGIMERFNSHFLVSLLIFNFLVTRMIVMIFSASLDASFMAYVLKKEYELEGTKTMKKLEKMDIKYKEETIKIKQNMES